MVSGRFCRKFHGPGVQVHGLAHSIKPVTGVSYIILVQAGVSVRPDSIFDCIGDFPYSFPDAFHFFYNGERIGNGSAGNIEYIRTRLVNRNSGVPAYSYPVISLSALTTAPSAAIPV